MKIALITIQNANNYGAILQVFAMQEVLKRYGDVDVLNYENRHISRSFDLIRFKFGFRGLLGAGKDVLRLFPRYRVINKFKEFINEKINLTSELDYDDLLNGKASNYDVYISGSDQIWNPLCVSEVKRIDRAYFLDFAPIGADKISYASSMGSYEYTDSEIVVVEKLLSSFKSISVREKNSQEYLGDLLGRTVEHVLDPTLLLSKYEWMSVLGMREGCDISDKYILLYTVPKIPLIKSVVEFLSKKLGLRVLAIDQGISAGAEVDSQIRDASPVEFVEYFLNAEFVITDSFHGTCFSLNFNKPFVCVSSSMHKNRIKSLLDMVGLSGRLIEKASDIDKLDINLDMVASSQALEFYREKSLSYIESSLDMCSCCR